MLALDLDNLKDVNDAYGHHAGDRLLETAATRIAAAVAPDVTYRIGGDEFAIILESPELLADLEATARRILSALTGPADCEGIRINPQASIGGAIVGASDQTPETVHRNADHALYFAKETSRGGFIRYWPGIGTPITERTRIHQAIEEALHNHRIEAWYQPITCLRSGRLFGLEAYCRLTTRNGQVIPPAAFALADSNSNASFQLTKAMLRIIARDMANWRRNGVEPPAVAVNITTTDLRSPGFDQDVCALFEAHNLDLSCVIFDIDESLHFELREPAVIGTIRRLRALGARIALDDFGKGFASLTNLTAIPVDILKLDPTLTDQLEPSAPGTVLVSGILAIAEDLGMTIIAAGVESESCHGQLLRLGCDWGQGHLISPAVRRQEVLTMLQNRRNGDGTTLSWPEREPPTSAGSIHRQPYNTGTCADVA